MTAVISAYIKIFLIKIEFLHSHFNIEDGIKKQHFGMLCFIISRKVKQQLKHTKKICAVYGEGGITDQMT